VHHRHITSGEIALAGVGLSLLLGLGTVVANVLIARYNSRAALGGRLWERRADAYVAVIRDRLVWAARRRNTTDGRPPAGEDHEASPRYDWSDLHARVDAFASSKVRAAFDSSYEADRAWLLALVGLRGAERQAADATAEPPAADPSAEITRLKAEVTKALNEAEVLDDRLSVMIKAELQKHKR
jgi:hypothetical protein